MKVKSESEVIQSCPTLSNPMDCSLPGSSVHGIFQARVLEWGASAFSADLHNLTGNPLRKSQTPKPHSGSSSHASTQKQFLQKASWSLPTNLPRTALLWTPDPWHCRLLHPVAIKPVPPRSQSHSKAPPSHSFRGNRIGLRGKSPSPTPRHPAPIPFVPGASPAPSKVLTNVCVGSREGVSAGPGACRPEPVPDPGVRSGPGPPSRLGLSGSSRSRGFRPF